AFSPSSSRVESAPCLLTTCVTPWQRPLRTSSASSWALWMMPQSALKTYWRGSTCTLCLRRQMPAPPTLVSRIRSLQCHFMS
ncbi:hypothetical protein XENORESO_019912, partial [Xenotaenia resolanae]